MPHLLASIRYVPYGISMVRYPPFTCTPLVPRPPLHKPLVLAAPLTTLFFEYRQTLLVSLEVQGVRAARALLGYKYPLIPIAYKSSTGSERTVGNAHKSSVVRVLGVVQGRYEA